MSYITPNIRQKHFGSILESSLKMSQGMGSRDQVGRKHIKFYVLPIQQLYIGSWKFGLCELIAKWCVAVNHGFMRSRFGIPFDIVYVS
jgi:hypothetical protein